MTSVCPLGSSMIVRLSTDGGWNHMATSCGMIICVFYCYMHPTLLPCNGLKLVTLPRSVGTADWVGKRCEVKVKFSCARMTDYMTTCQGDLEEQFHAYLASALDGMIHHALAVLLPGKEHSVRRYALNRRLDGPSSWPGRSVELHNLRIEPPFPLSCPARS